MILTQWFNYKLLGGTLTIAKTSWRMSSLLPSDVFLCLTSHKSCGNPTTPLVTGGLHNINGSRMFQRENISSSILAVSTLQNTSADIFPLKQTACPGTPTIFTANVACYPPTDESRGKKDYHDCWRLPRQIYRLILEIRHSDVFFTLCYCGCSLVDNLLHPLSLFCPLRGNPYPLRLNTRAFVSRIELPELKGKMAANFIPGLSTDDNDSVTLYQTLGSQCSDSVQWISDSLHQIRGAVLRTGMNDAIISLDSHFLSTRFYDIKVLSTGLLRRCFFVCCCSTSIASNRAIRSRWRRVTFSPPP